MYNYQHSPTLLSPSTNVLQFYEFGILSEAKDLRSNGPVATFSLRPRRCIDYVTLRTEYATVPVNLATFVSLTRSLAFKADKMFTPC